MRKQDPGSYCIENGSRQRRWYRRQSGVTWYLFANKFVLINVDEQSVHGLRDSLQGRPAAS
jgi:hypothetical protein